MTSAVTWRENALRGTLVWFCPWSNAPSRSQRFHGNQAPRSRPKQTLASFLVFLTLLEELKLSMLMLRPKQGRHVRT